MSLAGDYYYVPNAHVAVWEAEGWVALPALDGTGHGLYSTLMRWAGEGEMVKPGDKMLAKDMQVGGDHYRDAAIQPIDFIHANDIDYLAGNVIKYVFRHRKKGGAQDIEKAIHYCQLILEKEYGSK